MYPQHKQVTRNNTPMHDSIFLVFHFTKLSSCIKIFFNPSQSLPLSEIILTSWSLIFIFNSSTLSVNALFNFSDFSNFSCSTLRPSAVFYSIGRYFFKDLLRYPLAREGVYGPGRPALLAHAMQRVGYFVGLTAYG